MGTTGVATAAVVVGAGGAVVVVGTSDAAAVVVGAGSAVVVGVCDGAAIVVVAGATVVVVVSGVAVSVAFEVDGGGGSSVGVSRGEADSTAWSAEVVSESPPQPVAASATATSAAMSDKSRGVRRARAAASLGATICTTLVPTNETPKPLEQARVSSRTLGEEGFLYLLIPLRVS